MSCSHHKHSIDRFVNRHSVKIKTEGGVTYVSDTIFSGTLFSLQINGIDTLAVQEFLNGREHGVSKQYYFNGKLEFLRFYQRGNKEGKFEAWWDNGIKRLAYNFKNGEYEGNGKEWAANGRLIKNMNYVKGQEEGLQQQWTDKGDLWANYEVRKGRHYGMTGVKSCATLWMNDEVPAH